MTLGGVLLVLGGLATWRGFRTGNPWLAQGGLAPFSLYVIVVFVLAVSGVVKP